MGLVRPPIPRRRSLSRPLGAALATGLVLCATLAAGARAEWSGDGRGDVLAVDPEGILFLYRGDGAGGLPGLREPIGTGWASFTALLSAGDFNGDGKADLLARAADGRLLQYRGSGVGGFLGPGTQVATGWQRYRALAAPGDFDGDGRVDLLAVDGDGTLLLFRGDGDGGFLGEGRPVASGWGAYAVAAPGDFDGDGRPDLLARAPEGALLLFRGDGAGGLRPGPPPVVATGWQGYTAILAGGDFSGDGRPDVLTRGPDGLLALHRGTGAGGLAPGATTVATGWSPFLLPTLVGAGGDTSPSGAGAAPDAAPTAPAAPRASLGRVAVRLAAPSRCVRRGARMRVSLAVARRAGGRAVRVRRVVFSLRGGARRADGARPFAARLAVRRPTGSRGRVYARVAYAVAGSQRLRSRTVSRAFRVCG